MSEFFRETLHGHGWRTITFYQDFSDDRDAIDGRDIWDEHEDIGEFLRKNVDPSYSPFTWLEPVCECGGDTAKTTHAEYCPKFRRNK
jgi:hypothetical protein